MKALCTGSVFERVLRARACARSPFFSLHHLPALTAFVQGGDSQPPHDREKLSTDPGPGQPEAVDKLSEAVWLGCVVPKRLARRAVTRNLVKRQVRVCARDATLAPGAWVVRLRESLPGKSFVSASSTVLAQRVHQDLRCLFAARPTKARADA